MKSKHNKNRIKRSRKLSKKGGFWGMGSKNNNKNNTSSKDSVSTKIINKGPSIMLDIDIEGKTNNKDTYHIPKYKILNRPAFSMVEINLNKTNGVITQSGSMSYMDSHVKTKTSSVTGLLSGFLRSLATTSSMFMTEYSGTESKDNKVAFASFLPGDIVPIRLKPKQKIMISPTSLICYSNNLKINTKSRLKGILVGEGLFQTELENASDKDGMVWLASYGGYFKKVLKKGEAFNLHSGLFLCAYSDISYGITMIGNFKTKLLSGQGINMYFEGPCTICCQGRSLHGLQNFVEVIASQVVSKNSRY
jgi:uncharacterized protein (TIGR00266 family)